MQNNYNKLMNNLESLNLNMFKANLSTYLEYMENGSKTVIDILYELSIIEDEEVSDNGSPFLGI